MRFKVVTCFEVLVFLEFLQNHEVTYSLPITTENKFGRSVMFVFSHNNPEQQPIVRAVQCGCLPPLELFADQWQSAKSIFCIWERDNFGRDALSLSFEENVQQTYHIGTHLPSSMCNFLAFLHRTICKLTHDVPG